MKYGQQGVTLVELMISLSMGVALSAGLVQFAASINQASYAIDNSGELLDNAQYGMGILREDVHLAGFYDKYAGPPDDPTIPAALSDPCSTDVAVITTGLTFPIQGYNNPVTSPITGCLPAANHVAGTDILVVRRVDTNETAVDDLIANEVYMQITSEAELLNATDSFFRLQTAANSTPANSTTFDLLEKDGVTRADIRRVVTSIYHVSPCNDLGGASTCSASSDGGLPIPTLTRLDLGVVAGTLTMSRVPLALGVESFQVEYGIDRSGDGAPNETDVGDDDSYVQSPADTDEWADVVAIQVYAVVRSESLTQFEDRKVYTLGLSGNVGPYNDFFRRHLFASSYRVINVSLRRARDDA